MAPGKVTPTARLRGDRTALAEVAAHPLAGPWHGMVQMYGGGTTLDDPFAVHVHAREGVAGPAQELPHRDAIQRSFGHHDVGGVRAHVAGPAAAATAAIGAPAYATGTDVAFAAPPDLRQAAHEAAHVVQQASGVHFDGGRGDTGDAHERHADAVADTVVRGGSAESLLDGGPGDGRSGGGGSGLGSNLDQFAIDFNREFAAQLHVFADGSEPAAERGPDVSATAIGTASGPPVPAERLARLFTPTQIDLLEAFCVSHVIPERLFNGDEVGTTTAQQRILMAGHILSVGTYQPGGFEQAVHARMCGHWVNLTMSYAGCAEGRGLGVREEFDHSGGLAMSVTDTAIDSEGTTTTGSAHRATLGGELGVGTHHAAREGARADFEMQGLPFENFAMLEAGDWLYVYNDCGPGGGNHSVIFSRWVSETQTFEGVRYRRAITMSQTSPDAGGVEETRLLGEHFTDTGHGRITPVTHIERVAAGTRPLQSAADLIAILGSGTEAAENSRFIEQRLHGRGSFDWDALAVWIHDQNATLIEQLHPHMTEHQFTAFTQVNNGASAPLGDDDSSAGEALIPRLVRLNERLSNLVNNAAALDTGMAAQRETVTAHRDERLADTEDDRARLEARIETLQREIAEFEVQHAPLEAQVEGYEAHTAELRQACLERRQLRQRRTALREELHDTSMAAEDRGAIADELDQIAHRLEELAPIIERLEDDENARDVRTDRREARRAERRVEVEINRRTMFLVNAQRDLARLTASTGYVTAHGRVGRDDFNGRGEARRLTGLLRSLAPAPDWGSFIRTGTGPAVTATSD